MSGRASLSPDESLVGGDIVYGIVIPGKALKPRAEEAFTGGNS